MKSVWWRYGWWFFIVFFLTGVLTDRPTWGQPLTPAADGTDTIITQQGNQFDVSGGRLSVDGANLFHSFQQFGLNSDQIANFLSNPSIQNVLGRVIGGNPSVINGLIQVTGGNSNLFLVNPAGIVFGRNATLNVPASFTATTATSIGFDSGWFNAFGANNYRQLVGSPNAFRFDALSSGTIVNAGNLAVGQSQSLSLIGQTVVNTGNLQASSGNITVMAVPETGLVRVSQVGQILSLEIVPPTDGRGNLLPIAPLSLPLLLTGSNVDTGLTVNANNTVQTASGTVIPTQAGTAIVSGTLIVSGATGGTINVLGDKVGLISANVNASGITGGGTVLIGGDFQGKGTVPNASRTIVSRDSEIHVDAGINANGGKVIVWANDVTGFSGSVSARGGSSSGNGGFVEVSGKQNLLFEGNVDLSAAQGSVGTLLLDPVDITISNSPVGDGDSLLGNILLGAAPSVMTISQDALENLPASANVLLEASNNITIGILTGGQLTFAAGPGGSITFKADADGDRVGSFLMNLQDTIYASGRDVTISGASLNVGNIYTYSSSLNGGAIALSATGNITTGTLGSWSYSDAGGLIIINSGKNIDTSQGYLDSSSYSGNGGAIALFANGSITTSYITTGDYYYDYNSKIAGNGGDVTLDALGDIQVRGIDTQGGSNGRGGNVNISTKQFFQVTDALTGINGTLTSISTNGGTGGGNITIEHGGNGETPFIIGDATTNGTAGAITNGTVTIAPFQSFLQTHKEGEIQIITAPPQTPTPPTPTINPTDITAAEREPSSQSVPNTNFNALATGVEATDDSLTGDFAKYLRLGKVKGVTLTQARQNLNQVEGATGIKPAVIYAVFVPETITPAPTVQNSSASDASGLAHLGLLRVLTPSPSDRLELILVTADGNPIRKSVQTTRAEVISTANQFRSTVTDKFNTQGYLVPAQKLYQWLIAPLEPELQQQEIKSLVYVMDGGLRSIPLAALHDGNGFVVERYSFGLMPSLSLTDTRYVDVKHLQVLAMGAEKFPDQNPLPSVPKELSEIVGHLWQGQSFLDDDFTLDNLTSTRASHPFGIIHLATHGEFLPGDPSHSYIQFANTKLRLDQLGQLGLSQPAAELMVLSACKTALGDEEAELGFAGLAVQAGVKSALGSLWYVSDRGTLALMTEFYQQLKSAPFKAEALRRAQLALIHNNYFYSATSEQRGLGIELENPKGTQRGTSNSLSHPYYWAAFTMIGNPW